MIMVKQIGTILIFAALAISSIGIVFVNTPNASAQATDSTNAADPQTPAANQPNSDQQTDEGSNLDSNGKLKFSTIAGYIYSALNTIGAFFAWVGGYLLDVSLSWFVMDMPGTASKWGLITVITEIWRMIRDMFNLLFIFGIIFVGFKLILGIDDTNAKRTLGSIIIAALLINFSLYITQLVVDFSNIISTEISSLLENSSANQTTNTKPTVLGMEVSRIADNFVQKTDPKQINTASIAIAMSAISKKTTYALPEASETELGVGAALVMGLTSAFTLTLIGFVFAAGAFMMFARFLYLIFLMMFSPVMFLGSVMPHPEFKKRTADWWHRLISQALIGPAYLFMLFVALKALGSISNMQSDGSNSTLIGYVMLSLVVCGFAWAALTVSQSIGAVGATQAISFGKSMGRTARVYAGGATFGGVARLGRSTIGRGAQAIADKQGLREAAGQRGIKGWAARRVFNTTSTIGDSSLDARKIGGVGKKLGLGEGRKGGYATVTKEIADRDKKYAEKLGTIEDDDPKMQRLQTEVDATDQAIKNKNADIRSLRKQLSAKDASGNDLLTPDQKREIRDKVEGAKAELEDLEDNKKKYSENLSAEKQRIQLGARSNIPGVVNDQIAEQKDLMKIKLNEYTRLQNDRDTANKEKKSEAEKAEIEKAMMVVQEAIADSKKKIATLEKESGSVAGGYAAKVASTGIVKSLENFFLGRDKSQNENSAKKIREEYKKKIKSKGDSKPKAEKADSEEKKEDKS